jgi:MOSC domain-containing protein YiiM
VTVVGCVIAVCRADRTGVPKAPVSRATLIAGHGIEGDAHAGPWHRQLSLLDVAAVRELEGGGPPFPPGTFGENLRLEGVDLAPLGPGSRLTVGACELRVTQVGKTCHTRCGVWQRTGDCVMPRAGVFAEVVQGGTVAAGDPVVVVEAASPAAGQEVASR